MGSSEMRHSGFQRVIINPLLPRGHSCVTIKMTHVQLSGTLPPPSVWWTLLWGWLNLQLFRMVVCFPRQTRSDVYLTYRNPQKQTINLFQWFFSTPFPSQNLETQETTKTWKPVQPEHCFTLRLGSMVVLELYQGLLYSWLNRTCNKVHLINTRGGEETQVWAYLAWWYDCRAHLPPAQRQAVPSWSLGHYSSCS